MNEKNVVKSDLNENMKNLFILIISILLITSCAKSDYDDDDSYSSSTSGNNSDSSNISDNATMFTVTVNYGKYYLDGISTKPINLKKGNTYYFDLSHASKNSHPFFISTSSKGGNYNYNDEYTSGITNSRETSGTLTFVIPSNLSSNLYYNCGAHSGMGGLITIK